MAKGDDPRGPGWDEPPSPLRAPRRRGRYFQQISLRMLMVAAVYFALVSWAIKGFLDTNAAIQGAILAVVAGLGLAAFGFWAAMRMVRFAFLGWIVFVIGYLMVTAGTIHAFALPSVPILIGGIVYLTHRRRATDQDALIWVLGVAAGRGMPLEPGVRAFAGQAGGTFGLWAGSLAGLLRDGVALPDAIDSLPKLAPRRAALLIRMGEESGDLAAGLRAAARARSARAPGTGGVVGRVAYLAYTFWFGFGIFNFILYFIAPKYQVIFQDFGIELPRMTRLVLETSESLMAYTWVVSLAVLGSLVYLGFFLFRPAGTGLPGFDRLSPRRHAILVLRALAVVVDAGRPIGPALRALAQWYPTGWVRKRLDAASLYAEQGVDWAEALHSVGLLRRSDLGVLEAARRAGNLPWALRELAESGDRRRAYRAQLWSEILFILAILALGGMVFVFVVAYFLPLITLIARLS